MAFTLVDILPLQSGKTMEDARAYFAKAGPLLQKHGITRVGSPYEVLQVMKGETNGNIVNIFEVDDPKSSMGALQEDPDYQTIIPLREAVFDFANATILMTKKA